MSSLRLSPRCHKLAVLASVLGLISAGIGAAAERNLAAGKPYLCTTELRPGWTGLVDGQNDSDQPPACFATGNSAQFPKELIIDIGGVYQLTKIAVYNSLNGNTRHITVWISLDAKDFTQLRDYYFPPDRIQPLIHSFPSHPRLARYIKISMHDTWTGGEGGDNCLYLREVEVYGDEEAESTVTDTWASMMALSRWQPPLVRPHSVDLFRRYCLQQQTDIVVGILGDRFAASAGSSSALSQPTWVDLFIERLKQRGAYKTVRVLTDNSIRLDNLTELRERLSDFQSVDLLIIAYGTEATLADMPTLEFRRQLQQLVELLQDELTALTVVVTPAPFAHQPELAGFAQVQGKDSWRLARAAEQVATLTDCAVVRTASVLAHSEHSVADIYQDNLSLGEMGHLAVARALENLLW